MLKIAHTVRELDITQLTAVYAQSNQQRAEQGYPHLSDYDRSVRVQQDMYNDLLSFFEQPDSVYALWLVDGNYVSAMRVENFRDGVIVTGLETAPDHRRQGYATMLLDAAVNWLSDFGVSKIYSHVEKSNKASLYVHERCGFEVLCDYAKLLDDTVTIAYATLCKAI